MMKISTTPSPLSGTPIIKNSFVCGCNIYIQSGLFIYICKEIFFWRPRVPPVSQFEGHWNIFFGSFSPWFSCESRVTKGFSHKIKSPWCPPLLSRHSLVWNRCLVFPLYEGLWWVKWTVGSREGGPMFTPSQPPPNCRRSIWTLWSLIESEQCFISRLLGWFGRTVKMT